MTTGKNEGKSTPRIVALVPMRHHSQRVPGKNYRSLAGIPLYHHILIKLLDCPEIGQIVVDTDSPEIRQGVSAHFPAIRVLERPEHLRADHIPMNEVILYDTTQVEADFYLQTHSTNPLLKSKTISGALQRFLAVYPEYDSMFGVTRLQVRLWDQLTRPVNHNPAILLQTQDLPPIYAENSCLYVFTRQNLLARRNRLGERPLMFEINPSEAWDIDNEIDFSIVDTLITKTAEKDCRG